MPGTHAWNDEEMPESIRDLGLYVLGKCNGVKDEELRVAYVSEVIRPLRSPIPITRRWHTDLVDLFITSDAVTTEVCTGVVDDDVVVELIGQKNADSVLSSGDIQNFTDFVWSIQGRIDTRLDAVLNDIGLVRSSVAPGTIMNINRVLHRSPTLASSASTHRTFVAVEPASYTAEVIPLTKRQALTSLAA